MSIVVVGANTDHSDLWLEHVEQLVCRRSGRAMVGNLQHVDRTSKVSGQAACDELRVDVLLHVAGEKHPPRAVSQINHDRLVVHLLAVIARSRWHSPGRRPVHVKLDSVEPQAIARCGNVGLAVLLDEHAPVCGIARTAPDHSRFDHLAYPIALEEQREASDVVFVRMGQHDRVNSAIPCRNPGVKARQLEVRIGPGVDKHSTARRTFEQDRVALSYVEDGHVEPSVRPCQGHDGEQEDERDRCARGDNVRPLQARRSDPGPCRHGLAC